MKKDEQGVKCPECDREINELHCFETMAHIFKVKDGQATYGEKYIQVDTTNYTYNCPLCGKILYTRETDAIRFLMRGETPETELPDEILIEDFHKYLGYPFPDIGSANGFMDMNGGTLYTQIDGSIDCMYTKGNVFVNRTGIYAVIIRKVKNDE